MTAKREVLLFWLGGIIVCFSLVTVCALLITYIILLVKLMMKFL